MITAISTANKFAPARYCKPRQTGRYLLTGLGLLYACLAAGAEAPVADPAAVEGPSFTLAPTSHIYSPYLADPRRVTFGFQFIGISQSEIPDTGLSRFGLRMGGRLELFNWTRQAEPSRQLQANLEIGFRGQFDLKHNLDNIGWDGSYGLLLSYRHNPAFAWRVGFYHTSSHIGDEYAQRTGRTRIAYTREEILAGMQINLTPTWQYYLEAGSGYNQYKKPLQRRYRAQTGIQYQQTGFAISQRLGWYAALDLSAYEERDWNTNKALQVGFAFAARPHTWRLALDYYDGQSVLGEFFMYDEKYVSLSLYLDI